MEEPQRKKLVRKKLAAQNCDAPQPPLSAKRTRLGENQTSPPSMLNLGKYSLLPPPAPIAKPSANTFAQTQHTNIQDQLEDTDLDNELTMRLDRIRV